MDTASGIVVDGVSYSYGSTVALDAVSMSASPGRFTALIGPNGAGKSTLVALLTGLFVTRLGRITILGLDMAEDARAALSRIGVVFQQPTLDLDLSVSQNMLYFAALHGMAGRRARQRSSASLERLGLGGREHDKVRALSGGYRRRLEIARALMHEPRVLILDEPTVGLDAPTRSDLVAQLHALCRDEHLTVFWATHLVDEVWPGDDLVVLAGGRVKAAGPVADVLAACGAADVLDAFRRLTSDGSAEADGDGA